MEADDCIGVMLNFDLDKDSLSAGSDDLLLKPGNVATEELVRRGIDLPILVHSHNPAGAAYMTRMLNKADFDVVLVGYELRIEEFFRDWAEECLDQQG